MNRRNLIKTIVAVPIIGFGVTEAAKATLLKGFKTHGSWPNWNRIITNQGRAKCIASIQDILETCLGSNVVAKLESRMGGLDIIFCMRGFKILRTFEHEYNQPRKILVHVLKCRWCDFIWDLNRQINTRIDLVHKIDPSYKPEEHKEAI